MARRKSDDDDGAMDSLLDTMTNVVGILVIVLVVTQLGVGDAVQRISSTIQLDPDQLKKNQERLIEIENQKLTLNDELEAIKPQDEKQLEQELQTITQKLSQSDLQLKNLRQKNMKDEQALALARKEMEAEQQKRKELEEQIKTSLADSATLRARLDSTPMPEVVPAKILRLPNPRIAPEGVQPVSLICANDRVYPLNFREIQLAAQERAKQIVRTKKLLTDLTKGIDPEAFVKEFSRKPFRNEFFEIEMRAGGDGYPKLVLKPNPNAGARIKDIENRSSQFQKDIGNLDPTRFYVRFFVCADSFDVYLTARAVVDSKQLAAGWNPQPADWNFIGNMGGDIRLGPPKPPPQPNPNAPPPPPRKPPKDID